ncbi:MAG: hypothetical protein OEZ59_10620 [Deltaproteobacteria bacterium]|nr:hypothetical protein [Deltaproteobacteria bacterium]
MNGNGGVNRNVERNINRKKGFTITGEEVALAVRTFLNKGGLIKTLPPEEVASQSRVHTSLDSAYEVVLDY